MENVQVRQAGDLRLETQARLAFFLSKLELPCLVLTDIRHADLAAKTAIDFVLSCIYHGSVALDLLLESIERVSCLKKEDPR